MKINAAVAGLLFLIVLSAAVIILFGALLAGSLKKTIFRYHNVSYAAGMLAAAVSLVIFAGYLLTETGNMQSFESGRLFEIVLQLPGTFSSFTVPVILVISILICISNAALIRHEGFRPANALGILYGGLYIGGTLAVYGLEEWIRSRILLPYGLHENRLLIAVYTGIFLFLTSALCYLECIFFGVCLMSWLAVRHIPAHDKDFIIIPGCSISKSGGLLPLLKGRVNRAIRFAWEQEIDTGKPLKYVPSGGQGQDEIMSEGSAMEFYLLTHGAEQWEILPEKKSVNTLENFRLSKQIIDEVLPGAKTAFATTNYHVFRCGLLARRVGLDAEGIASTTKWYFWPNGFVREFFGILSINRKGHCVILTADAAVCLLIAAIGYVCALF